MSEDDSYCHACDRLYELKCDRCHNYHTSNTCLSCELEMREELENLRSENKYLRAASNGNFYTGLLDEKGTKINVGDIIKMPNSLNTNMHGPNSYYRIVLRGMIIMRSYIRSDYGQILPPGYSGGPLSDLCDQKLVLYGNETICEGVEVVKELPPTITPHQQKEES